jgi:uncharacterized protein (DUF2236 family)
VGRRAGIVDDDETEQYLAESVRAARVIGLQSAPASRAETRAYMERMRPALAPTDEARRDLATLINDEIIAVSLHVRCRVVPKGHRPDVRETAGRGWIRRSGSNGRPTALQDRQSAFPMASTSNNSYGAEIAR